MHLVTDYEPILILIVHQEFSSVVHFGFMFHFNQAIYRTIAGLGLSREYLHNTRVLDLCRQLIALSLVSIDEVRIQFQCLHICTPARISDLFAYFRTSMDVRC